MIAPKLWVQVAGGVQLAIIVANLALPRRIRPRESLAQAPAVVRQIFFSHWLYVLLTVAIFAVACVLFPAEIAGGNSLGRYLAAAMAVFWLLRIPIQLFFFDPEFRRQNRMADVAMTLGLFYLSGVLVAAALGMLR